MAHAHDHAQLPDVGMARRRVLWVALGANGAFLVVELAAGLLLGSLALVADGVHMFADVAGLGVALVAQALSERRPSDRHTFGLQRAEVLGAQANGVLLVASAGWILFEAAHRLSGETDVAGGPLLVVATIGLAVNVVSAVALARHRGESLNMRAAVVHMAADAGASVGVVLAGVAILVWGATWVDPAVSVVIALLVLASAWGLLRDTTHVLLEGAPKGIDVQRVTEALAAAPGVVEVHHVHVWSIGAETPALSAHVVLEDPSTLHDAQERGDDLRSLLAERFGVEHATLELECHVCAPEPEHDASRH